MLEVSLAIAHSEDDGSRLHESVRNLLRLWVARTHHCFERLDGLNCRSGREFGSVDFDAVGASLRGQSALRNRLDFVDLVDLTFCICYGVVTFRSQGPDATLSLNRD